MIGARTTSAEIISFVFDGLNLTIKSLAQILAGNLGGTAKAFLSSQYIFLYITTEGFFNCLSEYFYESANY